MRVSDNWLQDNDTFSWQQRVNRILLVLIDRYLDQSGSTSWFAPQGLVKIFMLAW
jgi:hypothetical protein